MKKALYILTTIIAIFVFLSLASATVTQNNLLRLAIIQNNGQLSLTSTEIINANAIGFICSSSDCSTQSGTLWSGNVINSGSWSEMTVQYPTTLASAFGYGLFFYKDGYIPYEVTANWAGTGQAATASRYLARKEVCTSPITINSVTQSGSTANISITLIAPINSSGPLNYIPAALASQYASTTRVTLSATGPTNYTSDTDFSIPFSNITTQNILFPVSAGTYTISLTSNAIDAKCISSAANMKSTTFTATGSSGPLSITINSPTNTTYSTSAVSLSLTAVGASSVLYSINGAANVTYSSPSTINFANGSNTLFAYAIDSNGTVAQSNVTFSINDVTAPGQITNLGVSSYGSDYITWTWTNPTDADFSQALVYLDGVSIGSTSSGSYTVTGLDSDEEYTITVYTKDYVGNINSNGVSDTQMTDEDEDDNETVRRQSLDVSKIKKAETFIESTNIRLQASERITIDPAIIILSGLCLLVLFLILVALLFSGLPPRRKNKVMPAQTKQENKKGN